ncbi:MAG: hypothetical protein LBN95_04970 [Prevotellaceae bacterium]|jgi:hypothetical protein|nr:hypothetical protein [Prevotellaceae bacterium]
MNCQTLVKVVIPIYKNKINSDERKSLEQCCKVLSAYSIVFVKPQSLDVENLQKEYPQIEIENFADHYFTTLVNYNRLMLSSEFYSRFSDCKYILIYQLDAYVFRDELKEWCDKNYDYIGAPWLLKAKYNVFYMQFFLKIKSLIYCIKRRPFRKLFIKNKIGNGGFSLRKVASHIAAIIENQPKINYFSAQCQKYDVFNEDVFWATQNPQFIYPNIQEALSFSIDENPEQCFVLNHNKLPFGCHGWSKPKKNTFWQDKIQ